MTDLIVIGVLIAIVGGAALYIYRAKKKGAACVGCPNAKNCGKTCCSGQ